MQQTRKIFSLEGNPADVVIAINELQFKGTTILLGENLTKEKIEKVFANNKSVICSGKIPRPYILNAINIKIVPEEPCKADFYYINITSQIAKQFQKIAQEENCDIGDHKSDSSGLKGIPTKSDCVYCKYLNGESMHNEWVIYESRNFFVMPTLGEFMDGYLLIIPIHHVMSIAELTKSELDEFMKVLEDITYILKLTYSSESMLVWENGTGNNGTGKAKDSIVHAHVHIAPSKLTADKIEQISGFEFTQITDKDINKYGKHSYLLIKDKGNIWIINDSDKLYIPRQYLRQLLAMENGIEGEKWNWRKYHFEEQMYKTSEDIINTLRSNWDVLPERIKRNTEKYVL